MARHNDLDFRLLPSLQSAPLFLSLDTLVERAMTPLAETWARADAAIRFCWYVSQSTEQLHADEPRATRLREAFLRACLTEYRAMDEVLVRDLANLAMQAPPLTIRRLKNPLLHLMKELRNLEIHLASSTLVSATITVVATWQGREVHHESTIWVTDSLTVAQFKQLRNARHYSDSDIGAMVDWFNHAQHEWGVHHLAFLAIKTYCEELVSHYGLSSTQGSDR